MQAALLSHGKVITGSNHGDAFGKLSVEEQNGPVESGFYEPTTGTFFSEEESHIIFCKKMYLVRHGETDQKNSDAEISLIGSLQAKKTAEYLAELDLSEFQGYVSPYKRCLQTADIIAKETGLEFQVLPEIRERTDRPESVPSRKMDYPHFNWPGEAKWEFSEEVPACFLGRVLTGLKSIQPKGVVVSHCDFILNVVQMVVHEPPQSWLGLPGGSITCIHQRKLISLGLNT